MAARHDPKAVAKLISFGTTQERKMFPQHFGADRLGIEALGAQGSPFLGPGSYLGPENILKSSTSTRPMSTRGYVMGARTAPRFQQKAQFPHSHPQFPHSHPSSLTPIPNSLTPIPIPSLPSPIPTFPSPPGTYELRGPPTTGVSWPMKFGAPDWAKVPRPAQRTAKLQVQRITLDKKFHKTQGREAYLKLYHG
uniref:ciliary microtubule-associated protein 3 n=1 Tax=Lonchura striata TaxID=40157 RepID=UPI001293E4EE|nr:protein pitchfork [Lonchura striata domestica]